MRQGRCGFKLFVCLLLVVRVVEGSRVFVWACCRRGLPTHRHADKAMWLFHRVCVHRLWVWAWAWAWSYTSGVLLLEDGWAKCLIWRGGSSQYPRPL